MSRGNSPFVDRIYEAAVVPELWKDVLIDFARAAQAKDAVLIAAKGTQFNGWVASSPEFYDVIRAHRDEFPTNERTRRLLALERAGFVTDGDVFADGEKHLEPIFRDFWFPRGYGNGVATAIFAPSGDSIIVHAECGREERPVPREVVHRLDLLRPHFARAALLSARLELERARSAAQTLELIGLPGAVLRQGGSILAANGLLTALMPEVVQDRPKRLAIVNPAADRLLEAGLARLAVAGGEAVGSIAIPATEGRPPMIVHLVPVRRAAHDVFSGATVIVVVTPVVAGEAPSAQVVRGLFDLTPAEARLAAALAQGAPIGDVARRFGISELTARTQLKAVFAKTGVHRQAELVALLASL